MLRSACAPVEPSEIGRLVEHGEQEGRRHRRADLLAGLGAIACRVRTPIYLQSMLVNELTDGIEIDQVLLVRQAERRQRRDGGDYLRLQLGDRTGALACMVWEELAEVERLAQRGHAGPRARALHRPPALRAADQPARLGSGRSRRPSLSMI